MVSGDVNAGVLLGVKIRECVFRLKDLVEANGTNEAAEVGTVVEVVEPAKAPSLRTLAPKVQATTEVPSS
ncbi:hypothetical protein Nepgr_013591 [Nepenthes gracilis]|uniref:Uncharacterized protein n=1 Tax=Nepenthes gracilis TaxID=150966 RepID=A0AAD3SHR6_NEPGR|nr:hypothetical protein Nepgr_013591 [Nepenthes gracilis]